MIKLLKLNQLIFIKHTVFRKELYNLICVICGEKAKPQITQICTDFFNTFI